MRKLRCLAVFRDVNNKVTGYRLQDENGCIDEFGASSIKEAIRLGEIEVEGLKLCKSGRIVSYTTTNSCNPHFHLMVDSNEFHLPQGIDIKEALEHIFYKIVTKAKLVHRPINIYSGDFRDLYGVPAFTVMQREFISNGYRIPLGREPGVNILMQIDSGKLDVFIETPHDKIKISSQLRRFYSVKGIETMLKLDSITIANSSTMPYNYGLLIGVNAVSGTRVDFFEIGLFAKYANY